jgi:glycosyltransferase involved in cell wall biosynthesis
VKVSFVVPRYGLEIRGGAEQAIRLLAEHVVSLLGWEAEVLTTCAVDPRTWADEYAAGTVELEGVQVHRFRSAAGRDPGFDKFSEQVMLNPYRAPLRDQERWIDLQGPRNPAVIDAVASTDADLVVFSPYLFYPTVHGLPKVARRSVFHPAAHDELPIRMPIFRPVFGAAGALVYYSMGERRIVEQRFPVASTPQLVLGAGVDEGDGDAEATRAALGLGDRPYLVYVARIDNGKGTFTLAEFFAAYKRRHPGPLALVLAGRVIDEPPAHPDVILPGEIDETTKWGLLRGASALVQPSAYESFSFILMEGWLAGLPALVNGRSDVLREHCERSGGGLWFDGYASFEVALDRLLADDGLRARLAAGGRRYVETHYRWPALVERYRTFLEGAAARA